MQMLWLTRFWERLAIRILVRSSNITMLAFKDRQCDQIFMAADWTDPRAMQFYVNSNSAPEAEPADPASMMLERLYHAPDAEKGD